ncbi:MAG: preprotein translocase subunit SecG [Chitinophagaceae bacterium]|jgi:preprotein translocase subunit SecG
MTWLFIILIVLACVALGFLVLVQNSKGGGLAGNVGGLSNQLMGVQQTTDVLEKGTWIFAGIIAVLAITSTLFLSNKNGGIEDASKAVKNINTSTAPAPAPPAPNPATTAPAATQPAK